MLPLFDMLNNAQNGDAIAALARQFNLSQQQAQAAVEALLPAFSQGLKRNVADPYGFGAFLTAMASGQHGKYFEDAANAFSPQGIQQGNDILGQLFGSKELSRAVAGQAAQATGIAQQVLQQMLPAIAAMIMGGLFKQSTGQMGAPGSAAAGNPLGEIIAEMMRQGGAMGFPQQPAPTPQNPFDNPLGKVLQDMFGGARQGTPGQAPGAGPYGDNPFGKVFEDMLRQSQAAPAPQPAAEEPAQQNPSGRPRNPYDEIFGKMFETGRQQRDDYQAGVESIFDQFKKGMDRYR